MALHAVAQRLIRHIDLATLRVKFDRDLGVPAGGGRAANTDVSDIFFRKDNRAYVAAFSSALKLPVGLTTMTVSIDDVAGNRTTKQVTFNVDLVEAQLPTAAASADTTAGAAPLAVAFDGSASTDSDGKIVRWEWYFGDGGTAIGRTVAHVYAYGGTFTATLLVRDNEGGAATTTKTITVSGPPAACSSGDTRACYPADPSTQGVGRCVAGSQTCIDGAWAPCTGAATPEAEACDGVDNDCDGNVDEDWPTLGAACTGGLGQCAAAGVYVCSAGDVTCSGAAATPGTETCDGLVDENCDGSVDEGCPCTAGATRTCYGGPAGTQGVGACVPGTQACVAGTWAACQGQTVPSDELCADRIDNDCDGLTDTADACTNASEPRPKVHGGCATTPAAPWCVAAVAVLLLGWARRRRSAR